MAMSGEIPAWPLSSAERAAGNAEVLGGGRQPQGIEAWLLDDLAGMWRVAHTRHGVLTAFAALQW